MNTLSVVQRFLVPIFTFFWWKRLRTIEPPGNCNRINRITQVVYVKGWRTALIDAPGYGRNTTTFLFKDYNTPRRDKGRTYFIG